MEDGNPGAVLSDPLNGDDNDDDSCWEVLSTPPNVLPGTFDIATEAKK
tara:strand:+ start:173 stop:316 length:144 start_codon:yes stop_codon:yes gene_type:complete